MLVNSLFVDTNSDKNVHPYTEYHTMNIMKNSGKEVIFLQTFLPIHPLPPLASRLIYFLVYMINSVSYYAEFAFCYQTLWVFTELEQNFNSQKFRYLPTHPL